MGPNRRTFELPKPEDALDPRTCRRCGLRGPHEHWADCVSGLRDYIAMLDLRKEAAIERARGRPPKAVAAAG